jgi:hypothetical protein
VAGIFLYPCLPHVRSGYKQASHEFPVFVVWGPTIWRMVAGPFLVRLQNGPRHFMSCMVRASFLGQDVPAAKRCSYGLPETAALVGNLDARGRGRRSRAAWQWDGGAVTSSVQAVNCTVSATEPAVLVMPRNATRQTLNDSFVGWIEWRSPRIPLRSRPQSARPPSSASRRPRSTQARRHFFHQPWPLLPELLPTCP